MPKKETPLWKGGRIDPDALGSAGLRVVRPWLRERLSGRDPHQPIDVRTSEDPDAFVVGMLREVGPGHPAFDVIARAVLGLLDEAAGGAAVVPVYFGSLLRICQQVRLPLVSTWFAEELGKLSRGTDELKHREARWGGYETVKEIVYAAIIQSPGLVEAASRPAWERLLDEPRYATLAFVALSRTFPDQVRHLGKWWTACQIDERDRELEQILDSALRDEGEARARALLGQHGASLTRELQRAIDAILRRLGSSEAFVTPREHTHTHANAIDGAGLLRELVLAAQRDAAE
jgi:hypothetical protein